MTRRAERRLAERIRAAAALCRVPLADWRKLTRDQRRNLVRAARWKQKRS